MKRITHTFIALFLLLSTFFLSSCSSLQTKDITLASSLPSFRVVCLNAGKADAMLLLSDNATVVLDTGEHGEGKEIVKTLENLGVQKIDYLILTHFDKDHAGGAAKVIKEMDISHILQTYPVKDNDAYHDYLKAVADASITPEIVSSDYDFVLDSITYHVMPPDCTAYAESESNNSSLVMQVTHGDNTFLFTGDAENARLQELLNDTSVNLHSTFLKVPYHGHYQTMLPDFLNKVVPSYAVITSSDDEPEDDETIALLDSIGCHTYLTRKGSITFVSNGTSIEVN